MPERPSPYRREGEHGLIEIKLSTIQQLYATLDPAPFFEKDLDADAEEYILGAVQDLGLRPPFKIVFCPSSDHLRLIEGFINGGFGPSGLSV